MSKKKRIKPSFLTPGGGIPPQSPPKFNEIVFSFKHLEWRHVKFNTQWKNAAYFHQLLDRMKNLCTMQKKELLSDRSNALRFKPICWERSSEKSGFSHLKGQLQEVDAYEFSLSANEHGRVHGFFIADIFYIVWLDPDHRLFP